MMPVRKTATNFGPSATSLPFRSAKRNEDSPFPASYIVTRRQFSGNATPEGTGILYRRLQGAVPARAGRPIFTVPRKFTDAVNLHGTPNNLRYYERDAMKLLFSITKKDLTRQTFRSGGKGGQNQNKVESGVRFIHDPSGARGEARDSRDQKANERNAFLRLVESQKFKSWHKIECARRMGQRIPETPEQIMARVDAAIEDGLRSGGITIETVPGV